MMTGGPGGGKSRARMMNGTPLSASSLNTPMSTVGGEMDQSVDKEVPDSTSPQTISLKEDHEALRALLGHEERTKFSPLQTIAGFGSHRVQMFTEMEGVFVGENVFVRTHPRSV